MSQIEVCLTPDLIAQHELSDKIVVVIDVFRATSCMVAGIDAGIRSIKPVASVEECLEWGNKGYITAGERGGKKLPEFQMGNSPFEYQEPGLVGQKVVVSTTNGTNAIQSVSGCKRVLIGSFLNLKATIYHLSQIEDPVVALCAGWKGNPNLEDTLLAGALVSLGNLEPLGDSAIMAENLYEFHKRDLISAALKSSHAKRLQSFGIEKDLEFCMTPDVSDVVVTLHKGELIRS
jgi:2-phosphosulfolactate phosphatase